jgi:membrane protein
MRRFPARGAAAIRMKPQVDRERVRRTLTFWLRPAFVLRVVNRFQRVAGFDRAVALASSALTALIPLAILAGAILPAHGGKDAADRIIDRYDLTGGGAEAVKDAFSPAAGTETTITLGGTLLLMVAVLSFSRAAQRLFEQTWELKSLSVRNTVNGLLWIASLTLYMTVSGWIHGAVDVSRLQIGANLVLLPISAAFLVWSGWILTAKRLSRRGLLPFGFTGAVLLAFYSTGAAVYVPHLFESYATRYGVIGAVFAMISALFCVMLVVVGAAALGREVSDELARIRRGERPPDDEIRREWDAVIAEGRSRFAVLREQVARRRGRTPS